MALQVLPCRKRVRELERPVARHAHSPRRARLRRLLHDEPTTVRPSDLVVAEVCLAGQSSILVCLRDLHLICVFDCSRVVLYSLACRNGPCFHPYLRSPQTVCLWGCIWQPQRLVISARVSVNVDALRHPASLPSISTPEQNTEQPQARQEGEQCSSLSRTLTCTFPLGKQTMLQPIACRALPALTK